MNQLLTQFGPWALVTGATSGIGRDVSLELSSLGFSVVLTGRDPIRLAEVASEIPLSRSIIADLATDEGLASLLQQVSDIDIGLVVLNAGFGTSGELSNADLAQELEMLRVNCEVPLRIVHHYVSRPQRREKSGIVFLSSILAWQGTANQAHYAATKAYVQSLAEGLSEELKSVGIEVLSVAPGPVKTQFASRAGLTMSSADDSKQIAEQIVRSIGKRRLLIPGKVGKFLSNLLATAPRQIRVKIMSGVSRDMIKKK